MKKNFSHGVLAIWSQITGSKGTLSSNRIQGLVDILNRELELSPAMIRYSKQFEGPDLPRFLAWRNRDFPDDYCTVFYHPDDLEVATGSRGHNWLQWSSKLLEYGRKTHPLAPRMKPSGTLALSMRAAGKKITITRFLSLELVIFYLAAQTRTWGKHHRVLRVKDLIAKNDVTTLLFLPPTAEAVDVDSLLGEPTPAQPKIRVPKAGLGLVGYNPTNPPVRSKAVRQSVNAPIAGAAVNTSSMTDDELDIHIQDLQSDLNERRVRSRKKAFSEKASHAIILHGDSEVWPDHPEYATMTIQYNDGTEVLYYHERLMADRVVEDIDVSDLLAD